MSKVMSEDKVMSAEWPWVMEGLPFYWRPLTTPHETFGLPEFLPFALDLAPTGAMIQTYKPGVEEAVEKAYQIGSVITGAMDEEGIGLRYAESFIKYLLEIAGSDITGLRVLDIGCGTGYLLHRLEQLGAVVLGVEPGAHAMGWEDRFGVPIVSDFFPSRQVEGQFELIVMHTLLEHVDDPIIFLEQVKPFLADGGRLVLSVPDCTPYLDTGDISFLIHAHKSYFTPDTLVTTLECCGYEAQIAKASFGGLIYLSAERRPAKATNAVPAQGGRAEKFRNKVEASLIRLRDLLNDSRSQDKSVGIYVPVRALNALTLSEGQTDHLRFFDDNEMLHNTYCSGFDQPIEPRRSLIENPTDLVLIYSFTFAEKISSVLRRELPSTTTILPVSELFTDD